MDSEKLDTPSSPPSAERRNQERKFHDDVFLDPYSWLSNPEDPEVLAYLRAENEWTEKQTAHLAELRTELYDDISARTKQTDLSVPDYVLHGDLGYWYYSRTEEGKQYPIFCRVVAESGPSTPPDLAAVAQISGEEVLLDCNQEAAGTQFFAVGGFSVAKDGSYLAYAVDDSGGERFTIKFRSLTEDPEIPDEITNTGYGLAWAADASGRYLFFTRNDEAWRSHEIWRHRLGSGPQEDVLVLTETDERFRLSVGLSTDSEWVMLFASSTLTTECRLLPASQPLAEPRIVAPRREGTEYLVEPAGSRMLILHNGTRAEPLPDFELAEAPIESTSAADWRPVIPHRPGITLKSVHAYQSHVVLDLRRDGLTGIHILDRAADAGFASDSGRDIAFPEPLYTTAALGWSEYETDRIRVHYTSLVTPASVYDYLLGTGELILRKATPVLDHPQRGPYRAADYVQERAWASAEDGTQIPVSIVRHRETPLDGTAPALLTGYGSYEISSDPAFAIPRLSLLDRGFIFAIAHIRGGGELGRAWYEQGKLLAKRNTFTDFIAVARFLVRNRYTSADRLAARGGSAGGLLMGAVANLAPDAFRAVHAVVPFVDALTTILDPSLPLTVGEWEEWGNPIESAEVYAYMKSYSPYENVQAQPYPAILATTSLNDTRVSYTEPAKWIAALRATTAAHQPAERPILLKTEMVAGHGGVSGRYEQWKELAFENAWIVDQVTPSDG